MYSVAVKAAQLDRTILLGRESAREGPSFKAQRAQPAALRGAERSLRKGEPRRHPIDILALQEQPRQSRCGLRRFGTWLNQVLTTGVLIADKCILQISGSRLRILTKSHAAHEAWYERRTGRGQALFFLYFWNRVGFARPLLPSDQLISSRLPERRPWPGAAGRGSRSAYSRVDGIGEGPVDVSPE